MPMPKPNKGESQKDFVSRFMGNDDMVKEFPENKQRAAVAYKTYRETASRRKGFRRKKKQTSEGAGSAFERYVAIAEEELKNG